MAHAPPHSNTLSTGVDGADVTTADPGSPDAFDAISGVAPKYTNAQYHSSPLSMRWVNQNNVQICQWNTLGSITTDYYCWTYLFLPSLPPDNNCYPISLRASGDTSCAILRILADGTIQGRTADNSNAFAEGTVPVATGQQIRIEWRVLPSTTVGTMEWRLYNDADSSTASDSASSTGLVLGANIDRINFGLNTAAPAAGMTIYFDDPADSVTGWIGPDPQSGTIGSFPTARRRSRSTSW